MSLCLRGEWIEIDLTRRFWFAEFGLSACAESGLKFSSILSAIVSIRLSACAESGLKFCLCTTCPPDNMSLCLRGEWIEIML